MNFNTCDWCYKPSDSVELLIKGDDHNICSECITKCNDILAEKRSNVTTLDGKKPIKNLTPSAIKKQLDEYVIGQEQAKRVLSVAMYNHHKRLKSIERNAQGSLKPVELQKSNILMVGPTGCGKTLLAQTLARILDVPFAIADATSLTESGYVGDDVESVVGKLLSNANGSVKKAEKGIIYIDEIDKLARKTGSNSSITRDVSGEGVQQGLLKIIEGTKVSVPIEGKRKHPMGGTIDVDTTNILFICGGSFAGIKEVLEKKNAKSKLGFVASPEQEEVDISSIEISDFQQFGIIPELLGRLPVLAMLEQLEVDDLIRVLTEPKNALIKQYTYLFELDDVKLKFTNDALQEIAKMAIEKETGARGLRAIIENHLLDTMFDLPDTDIHDFEVTSDMITKTG